MVKTSGAGSWMLLEVQQNFLLLKVYYRQHIQNFSTFNEIFNQSTLFLSSLLAKPVILETTALFFILRFMDLAASVNAGNMLWIFL